MSKIQPLVRQDPIFGLCTPLLFCHRGGVRESPESTKRAFDHGLSVGSDVLELDVQLTHDGRIVVWHGPDLDNVRIQGLSADVDERDKANKRFIHQFEWSELEGATAVADPGTDQKRVDDTPFDDDRQLLLLTTFLELYPGKPLNVEIKGTFKGNGKGDRKANVAKLVDTLHQGGERIVVVVSASHKLTKTFRDHPLAASFRSALSGWEVARFYRLEDPVLSGRALETTYLVGKDSIKTMRNNQGSTYVFLTKFGPIPALDKKKAPKKLLRYLLDRGVDGIMTDRPGEVRPLIDAWRSSLPESSIAENCR